jgi:hypothetical protein
MTQRPTADEYAPFYAGYIGKVTEDDVLPVLAEQPAILRRLAAAVPTERETYRYAPGKWSVREVAGHLGDAERVFGYRAWRISRGDTTPLSGFDENRYVEASNYGERPLAELVEELAALREANLALLRALPPEAWPRLGTANNNPISVRALAYIMAGHVRHHLEVLRERYGVGEG